MKKLSFYFLTLAASISIWLVMTRSFKDKERFRLEAFTHAKPRKLRIVTTLFPLFDFTKNLVKENAEIILLIPANADLHNYEPRPSEIIQLNKADMIIYAGEVIEPHIHGLISSLENPKAVVVDVSKHIGETVSLRHPCCEKFHLKTNDPGHTHDAKFFDPHVWLDFDIVSVIIHTIAEALAGMDPVNSSTYKANSVDYLARIDALDSLYREHLSRYDRKTIIHAGHYSFGYLTRRYNIEYTAVQDPYAESELRISGLIKAIEEVKRIRAKYIFHEELENSRVAKLIESETGVMLLLLNSAHSIPPGKKIDGYNYISIMEENLQNLVKAFQAQNS